MSKKCKKEGCLGFRTSIGGQALIEGIMMRGPKETAMAVRSPEGEIIIEQVEDSRDKKVPKFLKFPVIRGVINFVQTMLLGYKALMRSAELSGMEESEGEPSKFEKFLTEKLGEKLFSIVGIIGMVLGVAIAICLFVFVPTWLVARLNELVHLGALLTAVLEGVIKIGVFIGYIALVSLMPDIKRTFEYHGAEHKTIACYEAGQELTVENARNHRRFHPRCGTSFILIVLVVSILVFAAINIEDELIRFLLRIALIPLIVGVTYEIIKLVGRYDNVFTRIISAPGLWLQRLTTREPDDSQLEIAIAAIKAVLPEDKSEAEW